MAAEPTPPFSGVKPEWNNNETNISAPSPAEKSDGWTTNDEPSSAVRNDLDTKMAKWIEFLNDIGFRDWVTATAYVIGDRVIDINTDVLYKANTAHTSTGAALTTNDLAKWDVVSKNLEELLGPAWVDGEMIVGDTATGKTKKSTVIAEVGSLIASDPGIINGNLQHWQTNISVPAAPSGTVFADLFRYNKSGPQVHTISRDTDVPTELDGAAAGVNFSLLIDVTTANTGLDATESTILDYNMEGLEFREYFGKTFTHTFFVKSPKTGIYSMAYRNGALNRSFVAEYTVDVADTWEKKTITILHDTTGTWNLDETLGMRITWTFAQGSAGQATPGSWQNGNFTGTDTVGAVNLDDSTANTFRLAHISFNKGATAINNIKNDAHELQRIVRYFRVWIALKIGFHKTSNGESTITPIPFGVPMRGIPGVIFSSIVTTNGVGLPTAIEVTRDQLSVLLTSSSGTNENVESRFNLTTDARFPA